MNRPSLHPAYRVTLVRGEGVFWTSPMRQMLLRGELIGRVVPLIRKGLGVADIARRLEPRTGLAEMLLVLEQLRANALTVDRGDTVTEPVTTAAVRRTVASILDRRRCRVVVTDDPLDPRLGAIDREARRLGHSWIIVDPSAAYPRIGPLFIPGETGCWSCLASRIRRLAPVEAYLTDRRRRSSVIARPMRLDASKAEDVLRSLPAPSFVQPRRGCPTCGRQAATRANDAWYDDLFVRAHAPRLSALTDPINGVTRGVTRIAGESASLPHVYVAAPTGSGVPTDPETLLREVGNRATGSGSTRRAAIRSTLAEAVERYSGLAHGDEDTRRATLDELGSAGVHPNECMLFSEAQYDTRDRTAADTDSVTRVPEPVLESTKLAWRRAWSLVAGQPRFVASAYCARGDASGGRRFCVPDSNGCAAGPSIAHAIVSGFLELVERDAIAIWWYNRLRCSGIRLDSVGDGFGESMRRAYHSLGRELWLLDLTTDLGVPAIGAVSRRVGADERILFGFGADFDADRAAERALRELHQVISIHERRPLESLDSRPPAMRSWLASARLEDHPHLAPSDHGLHSAADRPGLRGVSVRRRLSSCVRLAAEHGMDLVVVDQTRPEIGVPVVKVIVPGLRPAVPRFAPGRLFDVPAVLTGRPRPRESEMNPIPFFL